MAQQTKHPSTQAIRKWSTLIAEWRESGLTAREFCEMARASQNAPRLERQTQ